MLASRLAEVGHGITGDDHRGISFTTRQHIGCGVLSRIETRVTPRQIHAKRISRPPGDDIVCTGNVPMASIRLADKSRVAIHISRKG